MVFRYIKFDTFTPAAERGLPVTRVVSRMLLQEILARAVGDDAIMNDCNVVDFTDDGNKVNEHLGFTRHISRKMAYNATDNFNACTMECRLLP